MSEPVLLTVKEVAETLGLSERTVYRLADSGAISSAELTELPRCPSRIGEPVKSSQ